MGGVGVVAALGLLAVATSVGAQTGSATGLDDTGRSDSAAGPEAVPAASSMPMAGSVPAAGPATAPGPTRPLVVCADPNNLPFSNRAGEGFENRIAALVARDMGAKLEYVWWAQRRGFVRNTLGAAKCDVWPGVATGVERVAATRPYYRSTYVFVSRTDRDLRGLTLDDPRLKSLSIGVQMVGNDATNTPPAHALSRRGLTQNIHGYMLYGDYDRPNPPAAIIDAVAKGTIDVGIAWGPLAGFFANRSTVPLRVERVTPEVDAAVLPMAFDISMGVRSDNPALQRQINEVLDKDRVAIDAVLREYHVPVVGASH